MWWLTAQTCDLSSHLACISWVTSSDLAFSSVKGNTPNSYQMPHHEDEMETLRRDCYYLLFWSVLPDPTSSPRAVGMELRAFLQTYGPSHGLHSFSVGRAHLSGARSTTPELRQPELGPRPTHI